jgi:hypothetical protein
MAMLRGIRNPQELSGLNLSQRTIVRIGALLKKNLAVTPAVLEAAVPGSALESALLAPALLERGGVLDSQALAQLFAHAGSPALAVTEADDGMRVLCLQEELDAGEGWSGEGGEGGGGGAAIVRAGGSEAGSPGETLGGARFSIKAEKEERESFFGPAELGRLRLKVMTSTDSAERIEAMRTLALAPLPETERAGLLLQGLSDKDAAVRAEAAGLLPACGINQDFADALSALNHPALARRLAAADRLARLLGQSLRDLDAGAAAVCVLATVKVETEPALLTQLLYLLGQCAPALGHNGARVREIVQAMLELYAAAAKKGTSAAELECVAGPVHALLLALGKAAPQELLPVLQTERERCGGGDSASESLLLQLLLDLTPAGGAAEGRLIEIAAAFLARDREEGRGSRAVGARLSQRGEKAALALCAGFARATYAAQKYFLLLLDDLARLNQLSGAGLERAAQVLLWAMENGGKGLRMDAMHCRLAAASGLAAELRARLADAFLKSISDFTFPADIEKAESALVLMGLPAVRPLLKRLEPQSPPGERLRAVRLLGELALNVKVAPGQLAQAQQVLTEVLRRLEALSLEANFPDCGLVLSALGKVAASPAAAKEAGEVVERTLLAAVQESGARVPALALEGLSYLAASRRARPGLALETARLLKSALEGMVLEVSTDFKRVGGETVVEVTGGEKFTTFLPIILKGLARLACAPNCPQVLVSELGKLLNGRWASIRAGELIWGPSNTLLLIDALRELACSRACPAGLRLEIIKNLAPRHAQPPVMRALAAILAADDSDFTASAALTIGQALLARRSNAGQFESEDREDILKALARIIGRKTLGKSSSGETAATFRAQTIDELFKGLKDLVGGCYEALLKLKDESGLSQELRTDIERRLREYHSLATR